ncbi:hypothetical protein ABZ914_02965 [Spirillospora sp. NPDC046719]
MSSRNFPFTPETSRDLEIGDFWAVELPLDGLYSCFQVTELARSGPGSRAFLGAGVVDWCESTPPTVQDVTGRIVLRHGLIHIDAFKQTGAQILGQAPVTHSEPLTPVFGEVEVGDVQHVWGVTALPHVATSELTKRR